jgi:hypothetical protein
MSIQDGTQSLQQYFHLFSLVDVVLAIISSRFRLQQQSILKFSLAKVSRSKSSKQWSISVLWTVVASGFKVEV